MKFLCLHVLCFTVIFLLQACGTHQGSQSDTAQASGLKVTVLSDFNGPYGSTDYSHMTDVINYLNNQRRPDIILITGDMVAGQKASLSPGQISSMWSGLHRQILSKINAPIAPSPGNHDSAPGFANDQAAYGQYWRQHGKQLSFIDDSNYPYYYSFSIGSDVLGIAINATGMGTVNGAHLAWIERQLSSNNHYGVKIVFGHLPIYPLAQTREKEVISQGTALRQLLQKYSVTSYLSGHHHTYYPGKKYGINFTGMPCLHGTRKFIGSTEMEPAGIVDFNIANGEVSYLEGKTKASAYQNILPRSSLPESISYDGYVIGRDDLQ